MLRAVEYPRVSTEEQAKEGLSLPHQAEKMNAYAHLYNIQVVATEADEGVSAKSLDRPALKRALAMLDRDEADGLLIYKLDRLSRDVGDWDYLIKNYFGEGRGKKLWSVSDQIDTSTASGRFFLNIMMTVAQWERETISERTRDQLQYRIKTGSRTGKVLYGKRIDPTDPRRSKVKPGSTVPGNPVGLVAEPSEVESIELMKRLRGHGLSLRAIADKLTEAGVPTRDGRERWDHSTVRKILKRA
jgi:site-specific DNA recombinase